MGSFRFSISRKVSYVNTDSCCSHTAKSFVLNCLLVRGFRTKSAKVGVKLMSFSKP